ANVDTCTHTHTHTHTHTNTHSHTHKHTDERASERDRQRQREREKERERERESERGGKKREREQTTQPLASRFLPDSAKLEDLPKHMQFKAEAKTNTGPGELSASRTSTGLINN